MSEETTQEPRPEEEGQQTSEFDVQNPHLATRADATVALARLQSERREALESVVGWFFESIMSGKRTGEEHIRAGLAKYTQAQNDIERLSLLALIDASFNPIVLRSPAHVGEGQLALIVQRLRQQGMGGRAIIVPHDWEVVGSSVPPPSEEFVLMGTGGEEGRRKMLEILRGLVTEARAKQAEGGPATALDALAQISDEALLESHGYVDAAGHPLMPHLDGIVTTKEGPFPDVPREVTFIELGANGVRSGPISAIACEVAHEGHIWIECIYVRFKGGALYRYWPFKDGRSRWADLVQIVRQMKQALPVALTVGEYVERVLKTAHNQGTVTCDHLMEGQWVTAKTPDEVAAARAEGKTKRKGQEAAVQIVREIVRDSTNPDERTGPHPDSPVAQEGDFPEF